MEKMNKLAVIGYPISHSFSPLMHNYISKQMNAPYIYEAIEVAPENLKDAVGKLKSENFCGFNVTAPHKIEIMNYLDEISLEAKRYNAVNTVVNRDGRLVGYNTDAEGFYMSLKYRGVDVDGANVLILGAGGAARPVALNLAERNIASLALVNRTKEKAEYIRDYVLECSGYAIDTEILKDRYDIIINCTSLGMGDNKDKTPLCDLSLVDESTTVCDMIYNPAKTVLLADCEKKGAKIINGLGMLIFQGILAYRIFTGINVPDSIADGIEKEVLGV